MRDKGKRLLKSVAVWSAGQALMGVFLTAFVLRATGNDISKTLLYQAIVYGTLPFGTLANLLLVGKAKTVTLYCAASLVHISVCAVLTCGIPITFVTLTAAGFASGMANGFLWPNRNMLVLEATDDSERNLYYGFELFFGTGFGVIIPVISGWFISSHVVSASWSYRILSVGAFTMVSLAAAVLLRGGGWTRPAKVRLRGFQFWKTRSWRIFSVLAVLKGGTVLFASILPPLLVMAVLGRGEGMLGVVQGACGIVGSTVALVCGRLASAKQRVWMFTVGAVVYAAVAIANLSFASAATAIAALAVWPLAYQATELSFCAIEMKVFDDCEKDQIGSTPVFLCAFEFLAALGRLLPAGAFFAAMKFTGQTMALYMSLGALAVFLLLSVPLFFLLSAGFTPPKKQDLQKA